MPSRILGRIIMGMAGLSGSTGLGFTAFRMVSGRGEVTETCTVLTSMFVMTGIMTALAMILNYRLGKLRLQAEATSAERGDDLRRMRLELQRSILDRIQEGTQGAQAYLTMARADALYVSAERRSTPTSSDACLMDWPRMSPLRQQPGGPTQAVQ